MAITIMTIAGTIMANAGTGISIAIVDRAALSLEFMRFLKSNTALETRFVRKPHPSMVRAFYI